MKKVFAIVLIVCLAFGAAFAAKSGGIKIGAQLGMGFDFSKGTLNSVSTTMSTTNKGFYFSFSGEYEFAENLAVKAVIGANLLGEPSITTTIGSNSGTVDGEKEPGKFALYVGAQYNIEVSKQLDVRVGAGFDMLSGKLYDDEDATNAAMGLGLESIIAFKLQNNLSLDLGVRYAFYFANTNSDLKDGIKNYDSYSHNNLKIFAGATYSL